MNNNVPTVSEDQFEQFYGQILQTVRGVEPVNMSYNSQINASNNGADHAIRRGRGAGRGLSMRPDPPIAQTGSAPGTAQARPTDGRNSNLSRESDMEIDDLIGSHDQSRSRSRGGLGGLEGAMWAMIEDGRRRDMMMGNLLNRLSDNNLHPPPQIIDPQTVVPNYHIMPDLSANIGDFYGEVDSLNARGWLETIESMRRLHNWPDNFALEAARTHLKGGARDWYAMNARELSTWETFKTAYRATFLTEDSKTLLWKRMTERVQSKEDSLSSYFHSKARLCSDIQLGFADTKEQILVGLWSKELCNAMAARTHYTVNALLHDMIEYERLISQRVDRIRSSKEATSGKSKATGTTTTSNTKTPTKTTTSERSTEKRSPYTNAEGQPKCFNCNEYGHLSRDCTQPRRELVCVKCKGKGHTQKHCPIPGNAPTRTVNAIDGHDDRLAISKYLKQIKVKDIELSALIDPGSSECTIKASVVILGGFEIIRITSELKSFGPNHFKVKSPGIVRADITVDEVTVKEVSIRIVPDDAQAVDVLIGRTFTEAPYVEFHKVGNELRFRLSEDVPCSDITASINGASLNSNSDDIELPPLSINFIQMSTSRQTYELPILNLSSNTQRFAQRKACLPDEIVNIPTVDQRLTYLPIEREDINVGPEQPEEIIEDLISVLNKYRKCVSMNLSELGCARDVVMEIQEIPGAKPVSKRPYRLSDKDRETMKKIICAWKEAGIVTETNSPYASPALLVSQADKDPRVVMDYRDVNKQTKRIHFPLPDLDEHLAQIGDSTLFITLDLAHGYLQVPLTEESRPKTAFITPDETGEFTRMMFGLMNSPFYFSKAMYKALGPLRDQVVLFYLDDIFIPGKDWNDLKGRLIAVLQALQNAGLTIKLSKCQFLKQKVNYLGFEISKDGIEPGSRKVQAITDFPTPNDVHGVRRFLGLTSFFRRFVPKFAQIAEPLHALLRQNQPYLWGENENDAVQKLKTALTNKPSLQPFNAKNPTELHTDASSRGLGAMLLQRGQDKQLHLVYAISRRTSDTEKNYHSSKLELTAIVWAVGRLRTLLINIPFTIVTDCRALLYLHTYKPKNPQVARWSERLSEFEFDVVHRPGTKLAHVDALSRAPVEQAECEHDKERVNGVFTLMNENDEILMYQYGDNELKRKREILLKPRSERTKREKSEVTNYEYCEGILYKRENDKLKYVVPKVMRKALVIRFHDLRGHPGLERTHGKLAEYYYFPGMRRYLRVHIRSCIQCIMTKTKTGKQAGELHPIPPGKRPFEVIHVDHLGPLITTGRRNKQVFALVDNLTRYVVLKAVRDTKATSVVKMLEDFVLNYGAPVRMISDRGSCFRSDPVKAFCARHGIRHTLNSPRHPQANGMVERMNATLLPTIMTCVENHEGRDWDSKLKFIQRDLNESINATTGKSPFELLYGYIPRHDEGELRTLTIEDSTRYTLPAILQEEARTRILEEQTKYKARYDAHRVQPAKFEVGNIVFMKVAHVATGESAKLQPRYRGPLVITRVLPSDTYDIADLQGDKPGRAYASTAHASQLKIWQPPNEHIDADDIPEDYDLTEEEEPAPETAPSENNERDDIPDTEDNEPRDEEAPSNERPQRI